MDFGPHYVRDLRIGRVQGVVDVKEDDQPIIL